MSIYIRSKIYCYYTVTQGVGVEVWGGGLEGGTGHLISDTIQVKQIHQRREVGILNSGHDHISIIIIIIMIYNYVYIFIYLYIYVFIYLCVYLSIYLSIYLFIYIYLSIYLSIYLYIFTHIFQLMFPKFPS